MREEGGKRDRETGQMTVKMDKRQKKKSCIEKEEKRQKTTKERRK